MFVRAYTMVSLGVSSALVWLNDILSAIPGSIIFILSSFLTYQAVRLLLKPLIGSASSDLATGRTKSNKQQQNKSKSQKKGK